MKKNNFKLDNNIKRLFPTKVGSNESANLFNFGLDNLQDFNKSEAPWLSIKSSKDNNFFDKIPESGFSPKKVISKSVKRFFDEVPNWRNPQLQYNICSPVNTTSEALMSLAQEYNIHNINNDFSGNCLDAEKIISNMMADLVNVNRNKVKALFSFGGTASNMYAMKLALNKSVPNVGKIGIPSNVYIFITSDSHFSHKTIGDWMGIGTDHLITIKGDDEGRSIIGDAEMKARKIIGKGGIIAGFLINGGPFYNFTIDDVSKFTKLRNKLVKDYKLNYVPHIHVDSVIGWIWLMFNGYDFKKNLLNIPKNILPIIKKQFNRAIKIHLADSWGVDFHKALGGCPVPCGLFVSNNSRELILLSKSHRGICDTHHLGGDWSIEDPSDITLETSRSAGPALAALGSLLTMGKNGFRKFLVNQILATKNFRDLISEEDNFIVGNSRSLGFNTMVIISPKLFIEKKKQSWESFLDLVENNEKILDNLNSQIRAFYEWNLKESREDYDKRLGCSFSKSFYKTKSGKSISGLKYCIVSPHTNSTIIKKEIRKLKEQFKSFSKIKNDIKI